MLVTRSATPSDFVAVVGIMDSSMVPHLGAAVMPGAPTDLDAPPFTWWGDPALTWRIALVNEQPSGFAMWRRLGRNAHLHCLFVAASAQRQGLGSALLDLHVAEAIVQEPEVDSFTLHVRAEAVWAQRVYARNGYAVRDPRVPPENVTGGLADWLRTYAALGWPAHGKLLMHRPR